MALPVIKVTIMW